MRPLACPPSWSSWYRCSCSFSLSGTQASAAEVALWKCHFVASQLLWLEEEACYFHLYYPRLMDSLHLWTGKLHFHQYLGRQQQRLWDFWWGGMQAETGGTVCFLLDCSTFLHRTIITRKMQRLLGSTTNNRKEYKSNIMWCASRRDFWYARFENAM